MKSRKAILILENGIRFTGTAFGYLKDVVGEVVFSTSMTGYQETITDPSYCGQIVIFTYPLVGNYGTNLEDKEGEKPSLSAIVVREKCDYPNNFRTEMDLDGYLKQNKVLGLEGIDTRALTKIIRNAGCMRGIITTDESISEEEIKSRLEGYDPSDVVKTVSTSKKYEIEGEGKKVALIDMGTKLGIINKLKERNCNIAVFPYDASLEDIIDFNPDVVLVSDGPGSPLDVPETIETVKGLMGRYPLRGICMGQLVIGLALDGTVKKLKFGHHGSSQPVKNVKSGEVLVTPQNHNYVIDKLSDELEVTYVNVNDGSYEGVEGKTLDVKAVQFYPEAYSKKDIFDDLLA